MRIQGNQIYKDKSVQDTFLQASTILFDSCNHTLGQHGFNTAIPTQNNYLSIINDGKTIIESLADPNPAVNLCLNTLKESSLATNLHAGDGTTSTLVLQHILLLSVLNYNRNQEIPGKAITSNDLIEYRDFLLNKLLTYKKDVNDKTELRNIITVSLGSEKLADTVLKAFSLIKKDQLPTLVKSRDKVDTTVLNIDGINLSQVAVNPVVLKTMPLTATEPLNVIILHQQVSRLDVAFTKLLQKISSSNRKTLLLYTDISPTVFDQLLYNIQQGALNMIPVKLNYTQDKVDDIVEDLGEYFNCKPFTDLYPYQTNYNTDKLFGNGTGYILNKDSVIVQNTDNQEYNSELLPATSSIINIGFVTYSEQEETYRRLEDAIHSASNALQSGYVIGGGFTLLSLAEDLISDFKEERRIPVAESLKYIYNYLLEISGTDDVLSYTSLLEEKVYDSYKVLEQVILNSFTVVAQIISTNVLLVPLDQYENYKKTNQVV